MISPAAKPWLTRLPPGQATHDPFFQTGIRFVLDLHLQGARAHLLELPCETRTEFAHRQMEPDLGVLPPTLLPKLIRRQQLRHALAGDHGFLQPFCPRHSRSPVRALCINTPKLVALTSRILQISPVARPSTSLSVGIGFLMSPVVAALGVGLLGVDFGWHFAATVLAAHLTFDVGMAAMLRDRLVRQS